MSPKASVQTLLNRLLKQQHTDKGNQTLLARSAMLYILRVGGTGMAFLYGILLARLIGVADYGIYTYVISWTQVLTYVALFGQDKMLVRNLSAYETQSRWALMQGNMRWSSQVVLFLSITVALLFGAIAWGIVGNTPRLLAAFWVGCILIPLNSLNLLRQGILQGLHYVIVGQIPEIVFRPFFAITLTGIGYLLLRDNLDGIWAVGIYTGACAVVYIIGKILLHQHILPDMRHTSPVYLPREWLFASLPFVYLAVVAILNNRIGVLMLGSLANNEAVGLYGPVLRGADLIVLVLNSANVTFAPMFARLYAQNDLRGLQETAVRGARFATLVSLPLILGFIFFGRWFLLLYGEAFTAGAMALSIVAVGNLVNVAAGSVGQLLLMTNHARDAGIGLSVSLLVSLFLNSLLIPLWGINGAAVSNALSMVVWNGLLVFLVYRRLGIVVTVFGTMIRDNPVE